MIVLENVSVDSEDSNIDGTFGLLLTSGLHRIQRLRFYSKDERDSWRSAIEIASNSVIKAKIASLKHHIAKRKEAEGLTQDTNVTSKSLHDLNLQPSLSCCFSCDSIPTDARGEPLQIRY